MLQKSNYISKLNALGKILRKIKTNIIKIQNSENEITILNNIDTIKINKKIK